MGKRKASVKTTRKKTKKSYKKASPEPQQDETTLTGIPRPLSLVAQAERTLRGAIENNTFPDGRLPTLLDLADQLRVSRETVRLALESLQGDGLIVKRRRRGTFVRRTEVPATLKKPHSKILGCLIEELDAVGNINEVVSWASSRLMLEGAVFEASQRGYQINVRSARQHCLREAFEQMQALGSMGGVIFACVSDDKFLRKLSGQGLPAVLMDHDMYLPKISSIRGDSQQNAELAVQRLAQLGHRRIACVQWPYDDLNPWFFQGYRKGMREARLRCRRIWEISSDLTLNGARNTIAQLQNISPRPTAIICFHNTFANQIVMAALEKGLRVPDDLSVVGGGGEEVVNLSCTQLDWPQLGRKAVQMLLEAIEQGDDYEADHVLLPYEWRAGTTTAKLKQDA